VVTRTAARLNLFRLESNTGITSTRTTDILQPPLGRSQMLLRKAYHTVVSIVKFWAAVIPAAKMARMP